MSAHPQAAPTDGAVLRDWSGGLADGLTIPFALVAAMSAAGSPGNTILTTGLTLAALGALALSAGRYFTERRESDPNAHHHDHEEPEQLMAGMGFSEESQSELAGEMARDRNTWSRFLTEYGLGEPDSGQLRLRALRTGLSCLISGTIPVLPFALHTDTQRAFQYSVSIALPCLFAFGWVAARSRQQNGFTGGLRNLLAGTITAGLAYGIAHLMR